MSEQEENNDPTETMNDSIPTLSIESSGLNETSLDIGSTLLLSQETPHREAELSSFLRFGSLPSLYERPHFMQYLQRLSLNAAIEGNYDEAKKYEKLNQRFYNACLEVEVEHQIGDVSQELNEKIDRVQFKSIKVQRDWAAKMKEAKLHEAEKLKLLREKHLKERKALAKVWADESAVKPYSAPSSNLQEVLYAEKMCILGKEYDLAQLKRKYAEELLEAETQSAQEKVTYHATRARDQLILKQNQELLDLKENSKKRLLILQNKRKNQERLAELHVQKAIVLKERNCHPRHSNAEIMCQMRNQVMDNLGQLSPRSQLKRDQYRKNDNLSRLHVQLVKKGTQLPKRPMRAMTPSPQTGTF